MLETNVLKLGLGLGIGNDSAHLNLMTRITKKYIKYLNYKKNNILNILIHGSKALETKYPKSTHVYSIYNLSHLVRIRVRVRRL